jgi:hypothetical protein
MYRISPQNTTKAGVKSITDYYRCRGVGGARSCGNMVLEASADAAALKALSGLDVKVKTRVHIPATSSQVARAELETQLRKLPTSDMTAYLAAAQRIAAEIDALPPDTEERWETVEENYTYAEMLKGKSPEEVGTWLRAKGLTLYASKDAAALAKLAAVGAEVLAGAGKVAFGFGTHDGVHVAVRYPM